jgi:hypothetical protein
LVFLPNYPLKLFPVITLKKTLKILKKQVNIFPAHLPEKNYLQTQKKVDFLLYIYKSTTIWSDKFRSHTRTTFIHMFIGFNGIVKFQLNPVSSHQLTVWKIWVILLTLFRYNVVLIKKFKLINILWCESMIILHFTPKPQYGMAQINQLPYT